MKKIISMAVCFLILQSCVLSAQASGGVPQEVMESTKSVVRILSRYYSSSATGSGFVIKNEPGEVLIVTNDHVVEGNPYSISVWVGEDELVDAEIVFTTSEKDLCVLRVTEPVDMKPLKLSTEEPQHGAAIYVVGYPGAGDILSDTQAHTSDSVTITDGIISAIRTFTIEAGADPVKLLQVNAAINSGNSGGPLFNAKGEVIGINTYKVNANSQGVFGSVAVSELWDLLEKHNIEITSVSTEPADSSSMMIAVPVTVLVVILLIIGMKMKSQKRENGRRIRHKENHVSLSAYMQQYPQGLGMNGAVSLLLNAAIQLRNLHNDGKLHLQICPDNILISADGASIKEPSKQETGRYNSGFAAPEVYKGAGFGITSDIYSFAAVLLYAATGNVPANSLQEEQVAQSIEVLTDTAFAEVLRKAMAFGILERTQSMQELIYGIAVYNVSVQEKQPVKAATPVTEKVEQPVSAKEEKQEALKSRKQTSSKNKSGKLLPVATVLACAIAAVVLLWNPTEKQEDILISTEIETTVPETTESLTPEELAYAEAETFLANGETAKAAIAFFKMGDYADARQRSFEIWGTITEQNVTSVAWKQINVKQNSRFFVGVKQDGTVLASSEYRNVEIPFDLSDWTNVKSLVGGSNFLLGLRSDGTIHSAWWGEESPNEVLLEAFGWQDIVWMSYTSYDKATYMIGLKADGTVVTAGTSSLVDLNILSDWSDIARIYQGGYHNSYIFGLKMDGTVVHIGEIWDYYGNKATIDTSGWTNIVDVQAGTLNIVGLRADGTVVATGDNRSGQCDVSHWSDIVEIGIGNGAIQNHNGYGVGLYTVGLKSNGTVVTAGYAGDRNDLDSVAQWTEVKQISATSRHVLGLRSDGTVVAAGTNTYGNLKVSHWTDVVQIAAGFGYSAGLKSNGTVVSVGNDIHGSVDEWKNVGYIMLQGNAMYGWCSDGTMLRTSRALNYDLTGWTNMKIPTMPKRPVSFG